MLNMAKCVRVLFVGFSLLICISFVFYVNSVNGQVFKQLKTLHETKVPEFDGNQLMTLAKLSDRKNFNEILKNILVERVVGTPGHETVKNYIKDYLTGLGWHVEGHKFSDNTPIGRFTFENIIATTNPRADRYLVLACHYDSKIDRDGVFLGATDSAVPCAMLLNLVTVLKPYLDAAKNNNEISLKLVFFDGEEAFKRWGPKDSIYGARKLAKKWTDSAIEYNGQSGNELDRIDVLVLLDLLGEANPKFFCYFPETRQWYMKLVDAETGLAQLNALECRRNDCYRNRSPYFQRQSMGSFVEDDHIPFLVKGVPILHIIPTPFPRVWHTLDDNFDAIDDATVENLNRIFRVFTAQYLLLDI